MAQDKQTEIESTTGASSAESAVLTDGFGMKKALIIVWLLIGIYFVIACLGRGNGVSAAMAMVAGFMAARNMADVVAGA